MMPEGGPQDPFPNLFGIGAETLVRNANRLGLTWRLRLGTVTEAVLTGSPQVRLDGDDVSIPVVSMVGPVALDARVYVIIVPPAGNFIIGTVMGFQPLQILSSQVVEGTSDLTLTTTATLIPGVTITASTLGDFEYDALGIFDFDETSVGTTVALGELYINGALVGTKQAIYEVTAVTHRATVSQQWHGTGTNGDVFELRARKSVNVGTVLARSPHSCLGLRIYQ